MNTKALIEEIAKLPPEEKQVVRDFVLTDAREHVTATLKERAKGPFVPFDPLDEDFFEAIRTESERILEQKNA